MFLSFYIKAPAWRPQRAAATLLVLLACCGSGVKHSGDGEEETGEEAAEPDQEVRDPLDGRDDELEVLYEVEDVSIEEIAEDIPEVEQSCDPSDPVRADRGDLAFDEAFEDVVMESCSEHVYGFVAASGSEVKISLASDRVHPVRAAVVFPDDPQWASSLAAVYSGWSPGEVNLEIPRSGEFFILVRGVDVRAELRYSLSMECLEGCDAETTRFPVVMVHGWTGFNEIGPLEYFYGVYDDLTPRGYLLYIAQLDPYNSTEVRSEQLAGQVDEFLQEGRARKVSLVAHSQGGLDSRRVISSLGYGDRVSALVTIATPHMGTPIGDIALGILPGPGEEALFFLLNLLGATATGREQEAEDSFASISEDYVQDTFNPENPDDVRVDYISWTGLTCLFGITCDDVCDAAIRWSYDLIYLNRGDNDGMVPVESAQWGDYMGEIAADHFDEVGQLFGSTGPNFDHLEFYLEIVRELAARGY